MSNVLIKKYVHQLQQAYYGGNWLDEDMEKKLRLINDENAFFKPDSYVHSVAEVVSHIVEWRKELLERFQFGRFPKLKIDSPNNWIPNDTLKRNGWAYLKAQLEETQGEIVALLEAKDDSFLELNWAGQEDYGHLVTGLIEHDIYHLGQIGLIYKMITHQSQTN
jgi:uncharacterized damage-inducible protein DinB